jgi:CheY-like chemotaxis protein
MATIQALNSSQFVYRTNFDGTVDAICTVCFLTVARAESEERLRRRDDDHLCECHQSNPSDMGRHLEFRRGAPSMISSVFVVDDEPLIASTTAKILQNSGYDARSFVNPLEALQSAQAVGPDLVIADVFMLELSGIDLAIRLKELCPTCKVLLFSGQAETQDLLEAARRHGHDFTVLAKPIPPTELLARIRDVLKSTGSDRLIMA